MLYLFGNIFDTVCVDNPQQSKIWLADVVEDEDPIFPSNLVVRV